MKVKKLAIPDVLLITPHVYSDERGFFFESFNHQRFIEAVGREVKFVQDNHSKSTKGVLRGIHYQLTPMAQGKLVRVIQGEVFDVAVDLRKSSPFFGKWVGERLTSENKRQLWIPKGFGHGFLTLSESAEFLYKTTNYYSPEYDRCIKWCDAALGIDWPVESDPILSEKDNTAPGLDRADIFE